jgi:pimeloyl-ACP methyl ester carboxylesterase
MLGAMPQVTSSDGTKIGYERAGSGPRLVFVDGALCHRRFGPGEDIAKALSGHFEVVRYDRRGRGESGAGGAWSADHEIADLVAVIEAVGGAANVLGVSSGAVLALAGAKAGAPVAKLVVYEPPFVIDDNHPPMPEGFVLGIRNAIEDGRRGDAVKAFLKLVGAPRFAIFMMRMLPVWRKLCAVAHTLPHDLSLVEPYYQGKPFPVGAWDAVRVPTLVLYGGKSPRYMKTSARALAETLPDARCAELPTQTHVVRPRALAAAVIPFLLETAHVSS